MKVTMQTIADRVGVSKNAVSLAFKHDPSIPTATREKIIQAAEDLGYRRNQIFSELMSQMRKQHRESVYATVALINGNQDSNAFKNHRTIPNYVKGCQQRAELLGYATDDFWLHDTKLSSKRWLEILTARGIRGIVIVGLMKENRIPTSFLPVLEKFPCIVTGVRTRQPALSFACVDHHILALRGFEKALSLGYKRPGLVLDSVIDNLVDHRFSAGYQTGQQLLPKNRRLRPLMNISEARENPRIFKSWLAKEKPDVIFTLYNEVQVWLKNEGMSAPDDIGLIQLEWRNSRPDWAGMNQHNDIVGQTAFDMLVGMIHRGETGVPPYPRASLIGPTWMDGATVRTKFKPTA